VAALAYLAAYAEYPVSRNEFVGSVAFVITLPAALLVLGATLSALIHVFEHKNYRWLLPIVILAYVGAYLYGFLVAAKTKSNS
jgi:hypothetical protein